jgi:hypothetical protein
MRFGATRAGTRRGVAIPPIRSQLSESRHIISPMSKRRSKDEILRAFRALMSELGRPPGKSLLLRRTGIKESEILYYWPRPNELAIEAGATSPNAMQTSVPESEIFADFARVCRHYGKIPTAAELRIATRELQTRTHSVSRRFGTLQAFVLRFRQWVETQTDASIRQLLDLPGWNRQSSRTVGLHSKGASAGSPPPFRPFLPAGLQSLSALGRGERAEFEDLTTPVSLLFERRVGDAFRCLGFEVRQLGQGRGRKADCLAVARQHGFAAIIDAKARSNGYVLGTEDRKFFEYASTHSTELNSEGITRVYLVVVASSFRETDLARFVDYMTDSSVRGVARMTVDALLRRVEDSIRDRAHFSVKDLEPEFFRNSIIAV